MLPPQQDFRLNLGLDFCLEGELEPEPPPEGMEAMLAAWPPWAASNAWPATIFSPCYIWSSSIAKNERVL